MKKTISAIIALILISTAVSPAWAVPIGNDVEYIPAPRNLGINVIAPLAKLDVNGQVLIRGGTPAAGQVLTSDAFGLATWEPVVATSITNLNNTTINNNTANGTITFNKNGSLFNAYLKGTTTINGKVLFTSNTKLEPFTVNGAITTKNIVVTGGSVTANKFFGGDFFGNGAGLTKINANSITGIINNSSIDPNFRPSALKSPDGSPDPAFSINNNGSAVMTVGSQLHASGNHYNILSYASGTTPVNGIKIKTNIAFTHGTQMPTIILEGYNYGQRKTIGIILNWYLYNAADTANPLATPYATASSFGGYAPEIKIARENSKVVIFVNDKQYYNRFTIRAYDKFNTPHDDWYEGWTTADEALTGDQIATFPYSNTVGNLTATNITTDNITINNVVNGATFVHTTITAGSLLQNVTLNGTTLVKGALKFASGTKVEPFTVNGTLFTSNLVASNGVTANKFFGGSFFGNGAGLTKINSANLTGLITDSQIQSVSATKISGTVTNATYATNAVNAKNLTTPNGLTVVVSTTNNGNVGIGTTNPIATLDVNGSLHVKGNLTVDGVNVNNPWKLVYSEDFESAVTGWDVTTTTNCAGHQILGGYNIGGKNQSFTKTYDLTGIPHSHVRVKFNYYEIDTWDTNETALAKINGTTVWTQVANGPWREALCGSSAVGAEDLILTGEGLLDHSSNSLTVNFGSTLNEAKTNESFGIDNIEIWVKTAVVPAYAWNFTNFGACSVSCGGGTQSRTVTCISTANNQTVADSFCTTNVGPKPAATQACNAQSCGSWLQANAQNCPSFCTGLGKTNVQDPNGYRCVSGEDKSAAAVGIITYTYGTWPDANPNGPYNTSSVGARCYGTGQPQDGDATDITVGCFCK